MGAAIDMDMRRLILFTNTTNSIDSSAWISSQMVVHIFAVQNSVIWKANTTITDDYLMSLNNIASVSYNTHAKRGVLVSKVDTDPDTGLPSQMVSVFDVSYQAPYVQERISMYFPVTEEQELGNNATLTTRIIRSDISEEGFIYTL